MPGIAQVVVETEDVSAAEAFYGEAFGLGDTVAVRASTEPTSGFRGFTMSLVVGGPSTVDALIEAALAAGATSLKRPAKSLWGYGGAVQAPDGTVWTVASSKKKDDGTVSREGEEVVLVLGVDDVKASKQLYADRGLEVGKSFGGKYAEFDTPGAAVKLALNPRKLAAKNAGVDVEGSGSHRLVVVADLGAFVDPDGFVWEARPAGDES